MHIRKIRLFDFKNYHEANVVFSPGINCITGLNGSGKTNLIDAIHYLGLTRSAFNNVEKENIRHDQQAFLVQGDFFIGAHNHSVTCSYQAGQPKSIRFDGKEYDKISEHIGKIPVVLVTPYDTDLIRGGSEGRRKFFDSILCQAESNYLHDLISYNQVLRQRNALLKQAGGRMPDEDLLEPLTRPLIVLGEKIHLRRKAFVAEFSEYFNDNYARISNDREEVDIAYRSDGGDSLEAKIRSSLRKDVVLERTTAGIHRDDYKFLMDGYSVRKYGSQGQQKSFVLSLKLAQFTYLSKIRGTHPIILLDDIFDKLDRQRIVRLMEVLQGNGFGQVFITDAREERTRQLLAELNLPVQYFHVTNGEIDEIEE